MLNFETLKKSPKPNSWLVGPAELLAASAPDGPAPVFEAPAAQVFSTLKEVVQQDSSTSSLQVDEDARHLCYAAKIFVFQDDVDVKVVEIAADKTELAVYSRSRVGYSDFGVNRKRVEALVQKIRAAL